MRNYFWVVEESVDGGKSWFPLFGEEGCCTGTKKDAMLWVANEKKLLSSFPVFVNGESARWRIVRYKREEK